MPRLTIQRETKVIDATDRPLGRLATEISMYLRGKHKPTYRPNLDLGDNVEVINANKLIITGNKATQKTYYRHSQHPGSLKSQTYAERVEKKGQEDVLRSAVYGMLPKNRLRSNMLNRLTFKGGNS